MAASCIKRWIQEHVGYNIELDPLTAGEHLYDGRVFLKIMQSYNYASECQKFRKPKDTLAALQNLKDLSVWLKMVGIPYDDMRLRKIANRNGRQAIRLLYELYSALENKNQSIRFYNTKQIISAEPSLNEQFDQQVDENPCLQMSLYEQNDVVNTFLIKQEQMRKTCLLECLKRRRLARTQLNLGACKKVDAGSAAKEQLQHNHHHHHHQSRVGSSKMPPEMEIKEDGESVVNCSANDYVNLLKIWRRKSTQQECRNMKTQSKLLNAIWQHLSDLQEEEFHRDFANKLLYQSNFEKNLAQRLNRIHNSYYTFCEHSEIVKEQLERSSVNQRTFEETYQVLYALNDESLEERKRVYELHRRLYLEKKIRNFRRQVEMCFSTVQDLLCFVFKWVTYSEMFKEQPTRERIIEWKEIFYKGQSKKKHPLTPALINLVQGIDPNFIPLIESDSSDNESVESFKSFELNVFGEGLEEEGLWDILGDEYSPMDLKYENDQVSLYCDAESDEFLNEENLHCYLYLTGPWYYELLLPADDLEEPPLQITGFIVHRLLELKYPLPLAPQKADIFDYSVKVILTPLNKINVRGKLKNTLSKYRLAIIDMPTATNFCIEVYKSEKPLSRIGQTLKEDDGHGQEDSKSKGESRKSVKSGKSIKTGKGKKSKAAKGKKKERGSGSKKEKKDKDKEEKEERQVVEKAVQVPSEVKIEVATMEHTRAGLLGKLAFETLHGGQQLSDIHLVHMLVEYIRSLQNIRGWLLINYPLTFYQTSLLEYILGGILVPTSFNVGGQRINTQESYVNAQELVAFEEKLVSLKEPPKQVRTEGVGAESEEEEDEITVDDAMATGDARVAANQYSDKEDKEDDEVDEVLDLQRSIEELLILRTSKILPRPNKVVNVSEDRTYFTSYLNLYQTRPHYSAHSLSSALDLLPTKFVDPFLFYQYLGIAKRMKISRTIEFNAIWKFIEHNIGHMTKEPTSTQEAAGLNRSQEPSTVPSPSGPLFSAPDVSLASIFSDSTILQGDIRSAPSTHMMQHSLFVHSEEEEMVEEPAALLPGDAGWEYSEPPIPKHVQQSLATAWEQIEFSYLNNLLDWFHYFRKLNSAVLPYKLYVREICEKFGNMEDERQEMITNFQLFFNNIQDELRTNHEVKCELYCRIYELYNDLCEIADKKKNLAENARKDLINENWVTKRAFSLVNEYINLIQIELDRYLDTLRILCDYHLAALGKAKAGISEKKKIEIYLIAKLIYPSERSVEELSIEENKVQENIKRKSTIKKGMVKTSIKTSGKGKTKERSKYEDVPHYIKCLFNEQELSRMLMNPAHLLVTDAVDSSMATIETINTANLNHVKQEFYDQLKEQIRQKELAEEEHSLEAQENNKQKERKNKKDKKTSDKEHKTEKTNKERKGGKDKKNKKKKGDDVQATEKGSPELAQAKPEELTSLYPYDFTANILDEPANKLLWEWQTAVQNEHARLLFRLRLIEARAKIDLDELISMMLDIFEEFQKETITRYHKEIKNIHSAIGLFKTAIDQHEDIKAMLILQSDEFYVDQETFLQPELPTVPPPTPVAEPCDHYIFTVEQLTKIMTKLNSVAPDGRMVKDTFASILEDMAVFASECGHSFLPKGWSFLTQSDIRNLLIAIFQDSTIIDWKEFLILALNLTFPSVKQLLDCRAQMLFFDIENLETITWENFQKVSLWFERNKNITDENSEVVENEEEAIVQGASSELVEEENNRLVLVKQFLFKLYQINKREMNYSTMLMAFCKGEDEGEGFIKGLSLMKGKHFIVEESELYQCEDRYYIEAFVTTKYLLNELLLNVYNTKEGIVIKEISDRSDEMSLKDDTTSTKVLLGKKPYSFSETIQTQTQTLPVNYVSVVPYDMALSLIVHHLHVQPLSSEHFDKGLAIGEKLKQLYLRKGTWDMIRSYTLYKSNIIASVGCFKAINISSMVENVAEAKHNLLPLLDNQELTIPLLSLIQTN